MLNSLKASEHVRCQLPKKNIAIHALPPAIECPDTPTASREMNPSTSAALRFRHSRALQEGTGSRFKPLRGTRSMPRILSVARALPNFMRASRMIGDAKQRRNEPMPTALERKSRLKNR